MSIVIENTEFGWKLLSTKEMVEVWQTCTRYLACYKYGGKFVFCDSFEEAKAAAIEIYDQIKLESNGALV